MSRKNIVVSAVGIVIVIAIILTIKLNSNQKDYQDPVTDTVAETVEPNNGLPTPDNNTNTEKEIIEENTPIMPDVCGLILSEATKKMVNAGIRYYDIVWEEDSEHPSEVLSQGIAPGETVDTSVPVTIVVSNIELPLEENEYKIIVGSYIGCTINEATENIIDDDLSIGGVYKETSNETQDNIEAGTVVRQTPEAGTEVDPQTEITLYYRGE